MNYGFRPGAVVLSLVALVAACGGGSGGGGESPVLTSRVAFVTSIQGTGNLSTWSSGTGTGIARADSICQTRAAAAGLTGTFKAWLSDSVDDAYCRIAGYSGKRAAKCGQATLPTSAGPWVRMDGFPFAATINQIANFASPPAPLVYAPVMYDELGASVSQSTAFYYTATDNDGAVTIPWQTSCSDWTSTTGGVLNGTATGTGSWTYFGVNDCNTEMRLLCMQTGPGAALPSFATTGKKVFVTSTTYTGNLGGLAGADAKCQARAAAASLTGTFKAWLSDGTTNAAARITNTTGPWVRLDGVKVADTLADLTDGSLFTSIGVTELGGYRYSAVWTGTKTDGTKNTDTCNNWSDGTAASNGAVGTSSDALGYWTELFPYPCDFAISFYCIQD